MDGRIYRLRGIKALFGAAALLIALVVTMGVAGAAPDPTTSAESAGSSIALPAAASGSAAVVALGDHLPAVARAYGLSGAQLRARFEADQHLAVDPEGRLFYADATMAPEPLVSETTPPAAAPLADTFRLHSQPGVDRVLYLDFDGHLLSGTAWNNNFNGGADIVCPPFDFEGGAQTFTDAELLRIQQIWRRVAEDYAPFLVDVTTEYPGEAAMTRGSESDTQYGMRILISPISGYIGKYGGVAYVGAFDNVGDSYKPALVLPENLYNNEKYVAESASHEAGHTLALWHDGTTTGAEYHPGFGSGETGWAPIMGVGYYRNLTMWSRGEYTAANNTQDDLAAVTANGLTFRPDDHADHAGAATPLPGTGAVSSFGLIGASDDVDMFAVTSGGGTLTVSATPATLGPNLDVHLELRDAAGSVLAFGNPGDLLSAGLSATVQQGTYYVAVQGTGKGDPSVDGYSAYGSLGWYTLTADVPAGSTPNQPPLADVSVSPFSGEAPLVVAIDGSRSVDLDGVITSYDWDLGDGSTGAGPAVNHVYTTPGTYTVLLTVTDDRGATAFASTSVHVYTPNQAPLARVTATPTAGDAPLPVTFDGTGSYDPDGSVVSYSWAFGDGTYGSGPSPAHTYVEPGSYTALLTVADDVGATDSAQVTIVVQAQAVATLHVESVSIVTTKIRGGYVARAFVTVVDQDGTPVPEATVSGTFVGAATNAGSTATDATGVAELSSRKFKKLSSIDFVVTSVTKPGYVYLP